ncbi:MULTISPECIES: PAS domain S-box protein [Bacillaceae]|uniref:PAS domain S-box protein n=1 Tax=Bacillaceae TaxID=186817 RepID=UPI001E4AC181|nr:PAS domain S-box protein [Bacillus sp. Au-Bac7]MCE4048943.1 PAS domain S-box protein [Bacillus sp. Au-Bac7]
MSKKNFLYLYIVVSLLWIFGTDYLLNFVDSKSTMLFLQKLKGILYVCFTSILIYVLIVRKEEFETVTEEKKQLQTLINSMVDFVKFKDGDGRWLEVNEAGLKFFQLEGLDFRGKTDSEMAKFTDFYHDALVSIEQSDEEAWKSGKVTRHLEYLSLPNGEMRTFDTIKVPNFNDDGSRHSLVIIGRDITDHLMTEKDLSTTKQQYQSLFENNPDMVYVLDLDGKVVNVNRQFEKITGYSAEEFIGKEIVSLVTDEFQELLRNSLLSHVLQGKSSTKETKIKKRDGSISDISCTTFPMMLDGEIVGVIGYGRDVTAIKETEAMLRKAEKLSVAGELAASVAHEIRNPLTSIRGFIQLMKSDNKPSDKTFHQIVLDEIDRINDIVSELLLLAKPQELAYEKARVESIMSSVFGLLESQSNLYGVETKLEVLGALPEIDCEPNQLKQLFINIIKNSIEADSNKVNITMKNTKDGFIRIKVKDDGCGIEKDRIKRLGEPFYSAKEKGTGLGLTVSYRIVQAHKGKIRYASEVNEGTEVEILLPISID